MQVVADPPLMLGIHPVPAPMLSWADIAPGQVLYCCTLQQLPQVNDCCMHQPCNTMEQPLANCNRRSQG